jgi:hypothetical protein
MPTNNFVLTGDSIGHALIPGISANYWAYPQGGAHNLAATSREEADLSTSGSESTQHAAGCSCGICTGGT